jgi:hypothetical protein
MVRNSPFCKLFDKYVEKIRENLRQSGIVNALVEALTSPSLQIQEQAARLITNMSMDGKTTLCLSISNM